MALASIQIGKTIDISASLLVGHLRYVVVSKMPDLEAT